MTKPGALTHVCPTCGAILVIKTNRATRVDFWGCARYPACDYTKPLTPDVAMRLAGARTLPGLE